MIPNHKQFIEAIQETKKVCVRFYSNADSGVVDLVCAPLDYGPSVETPDGVNRYSLWDYSSNNGTPILKFLSEQILDMRILGHDFNPAEFAPLPLNWAVSRTWSIPAAQTAMASAQLVSTETRLDSPKLAAAAIESANSHE